MSCNLEEVGPVEEVVGMWAPPCTVVLGGFRRGTTVNSQFVGLI